VLLEKSSKVSLRFRYRIRISYEYLGCLPFILFWAKYLYYNAIVEKTKTGEMLAAKVVS
jgi:hypothetical protein